MGKRVARETTREQIMRHAVDLFAAKGYAGTSLDDIASAVGIRKPSLYHYIRSKEDLLYEINAQLTEELLEAVARELEAASSPSEQLRAFLRAFLQLLARRQHEVTVFTTERHILRSRSRRWREVVERRAAWQEILQGILRDGIADGSFRAVPISVTAQGIIGTLSTVHLWYRRDGALTPEQIAEVFADIMLSGIEG
jgi:TetR/AcrR family transcriptional regulator, cholesterol catabolism regulator